jgi:hypothetical protein
MVGRLESTFPCRFKGRKVFTYHDGRLLSHSISFYQHHTRYHVNGFGGCWWGLHFMWGKYRYGCAPVRRFCIVSSRKICPSDGRLSFLPKLLPHVLTLIQYKVSDKWIHEGSCSVETGLGGRSWTSRQDTPPKESRYPINKVATMVAQSEYIQYDQLGCCKITYTLFVWTICRAARRQNRCQYRKGPQHIWRQTNNIIIYHSHHLTPHCQWLLDNTLQYFVLASK